MKLEFESFENFGKFKAMVERQSGRKLKVLRTDCGGELTSIDFSEFFGEHGIRRELTTPYTPEQNRVAERKNRTVVEMARSMLRAKGIPNEFWSEIVAAVIYILNISWIIAVLNLTPFEARRDKKPRVSTFKKFPDMMMIVTWYVIFGTIQTAVVDLLAERDLSAWKLSINLELIIIILTAVFGTFVRSRVQAWCMSRNGVVYVSLFKPFGIFWACAISLSFFPSSLHIGSVMGAAVSGIGYYTMLWGSVKEEEKKTDESDKLAQFVEDDQFKAPLLRNEENQV